MSAPSDWIEREAQQLANEVHLFSTRELRSLAALYGVSLRGTVGELRSAVGAARAHDLRPQAEPVTPFSAEECLEILRANWSRASLSTGDGK